MNEWRLSRLFTLTKASNHFLPVDEPVPVDMLLYICVDQPGIEACVANYRAFQLEMLADDFSADLLSLKMHKPGRGSACDHFVYCLVRVSQVHSHGSKSMLSYKHLAAPS